MCYIRELYPYVQNVLEMCTKMCTIHFVTGVQNILEWFEIWYLDINKDIAIQNICCHNFSEYVPLSFVWNQAW